tara:strand:+ start:112 stop:474 length:363 start_codon:yes stop_codon:yes gene_type:complete
MIKNSIHYQITGDLIADFGTTISNPIIKIAVSDRGVISDGLLKCEYNIYISGDAYEYGKYFFKAEKDGERLINFTYPIENVLTWSILTYKEDQRKIIADTFGFEIEKVVLVEEPTEEISE